jgi:hypothetical protein
MTGWASRALVAAAFLLSMPASPLAQSSATYKLTEHVFNAGELLHLHYGRLAP